MTYILNLRYIQVILLLFRVSIFMCGRQRLHATNYLLKISNLNLLYLLFHWGYSHAKRDTPINKHIAKGCRGYRAKTELPEQAYA